MMAKFTLNFAYSNFVTSSNYIQQNSQPKGYASCKMEHTSAWLHPAKEQKDGKDRNEGKGWKGVERTKDFPPRGPCPSAVFSAFRPFAGCTRTVLSQSTRDLH